MTDCIIVVVVEIVEIVESLSLSFATCTTSNTFYTTVVFAHRTSTATVSIHFALVGA